MESKILQALGKWRVFGMLNCVMLGETDEVPEFLHDAIDGKSNKDKYKIIYDNCGGDPRANIGFKGLLYLYSPTMAIRDANEETDPYRAIFGEKPPSKAELKRAIDLMMDEE